MVDIIYIDNLDLERLKIEGIIEYGIEENITSQYPPTSQVTFQYLSWHDEFAEIMYNEHGPIQLWRLP